MGRFLEISTLESQLHLLEGKNSLEFSEREFQNFKMTSLILTALFDSTLYVHTDCEQLVFLLRSLVYAYELHIGWGEIFDSNLKQEARHRIDIFLSITNTWYDNNAYNTFQMCRVNETIRRRYRNF
jgi:hypothetical protein